MKIKTGLTIMAVMCMAVPAFSDTFPSNGYMQANKTYTNAATYENLGAYEGPVAATANYENVLYNISAGQYLAAATETGTTCTAGNFCTGLTNATYDANNDQGITACSTLSSGAYPNSEAGAKANTACYHACTTSDSNIAHAATFTGNAYYGGTNTCELASCESGYHIKPPVCTPDTTISTTIGTTSGNVYSAILNNGNAYYQGGNPASYGISEKNSFAVSYYGIGILVGRGRCSKTEGSKNPSNRFNYTYYEPTTYDILEDETGQSGANYCYCRIDGFTPSGGTLQSLSSPWVNNNTISGCDSQCSVLCAQGLHFAQTSYLEFRSAILSAIGTCSDSSCVSDTITINWSDASQADIEANEAGTATWGGDIRTPRAAATKPGKRFIGWTFGPAE